MNKNYERCQHCNRRKWLATGCLRKWLKPNGLECKHLQRSIDNKRDFNNTDIVNSVFLSDCKPSANTNKFVKFWKNKLFITGSVRSLQRYFVNKNNGEEYMCTTNKSNNNSTSIDKKIAFVTGYENKKDESKHPTKCQHSHEGHSVLRGHHQHSSIETCAIYCQLSKYVILS